MNKLDHTQVTNQAEFSLSHSENYGLIHRFALISVLIFIFLIPWGDGLWDGLARIFGIVSFGLAGLLLVTKGTHTSYTFYHLFVILFGVWVIFTVIWTPDMDRGTELAPRVFQIMLLPFLFTLIIDKKASLLLAYQSYVAGTLVASSIIFYNYLNNIQSPYYNRYTVQNIETDQMSIILALAIPMAAYLASVHQNKWLRIFNMLAIPYIIYAIFLTGTRTGSVVAIIGVGYWLFTHRNASLRIKASILIVFITSIIAILSFAPKASVDRVFSTGKSLKSGNLNSRTFVWKASIKEWKKSPIFGVGLGGLGHVLSKNHINYREAHNTYIHLMTENGIIGLTIYLLILLNIFYLVLQTRISEKVFLLSLLMVILVSQLTLHTQIQKETWFALTMLVIHALLSIKKTKSLTG